VESPRHGSWWTPPASSGADRRRTARADAVASDPAGPSIFAALQQQLGWKLTTAKGPGEFLVVDGIERPSEKLACGWILRKES
jgi:uncharacterized protein (TIGR03435 family)